jgi:formate/nitrite transporter FocA (FNT family)
MFVTTRYTFDGGPVGLTALATAEAKASLGFVPAVALGIMCNALVCLAVWMCYSARTTADRILIIVPPIAAFVSRPASSTASPMFIPAHGLFHQGRGAAGFLGLACLLATARHANLLLRPRLTPAIEVRQNQKTRSRPGRKIRRTLRGAMS